MNHPMVICLVAGALLGGVNLLFLDSDLVDYDLVFYLTLTAGVGIGWNCEDIARFFGWKGR